MPVRRKTDTPQKPVVESTRTKQDAMTLLTQSFHGDLKAYKEPVAQAMADDQEFFAHLIAYNQRKGTIRDAKAGLPFWNICYTAPEYLENALAHLALQSPRQLLQVYRLALEVRPQGRMAQFKSLVSRYLKAREYFPQWFSATALQHRSTLKELYALTHTKTSQLAQRVLFSRAYDEDKDGVFFAVQHLADYPTAQEIGGVIAQYNIPFLVARGALGKRLKEPDVLLAVIDRMSPTELVTNARALTKLGVQETSAVRGSMTQGLKRARKSKVNVLKTTQAAQALAKDDPDDELVTQLEDLQERQLVRSVEGNWLVLADKSGSMQAAIEVSRQVAGLLARMVKGKVHLVFFDTSARIVDVTGKTYEEIQKITAGVSAAGGTSIGCALMAAFDRGLPIDGIAIVSDGGENNSPRFSWVYDAAYSKQNVTPPIYFYHLRGEGDSLSASLREKRIDFQTFDLQAVKLDYYSLPGLVETMNVKRYDLVQQIYDTPLLTMQQALRVPKRFVGVAV